MLVSPKAKGKRAREANKPMSGLDVDALLGQNKRAKISADNAIPEFKQALNSSEDVKQIEEAAKQMGEVIRSIIASSTGDSGYDRALENLGVMRGELIALEEPGLYNSFLEDLKEKVRDEKLGGDRKLLWWKLGKSGLGLVTDRESDISTVTQPAAEEVTSIVPFHH